ncbi:FecR family protein [Rufibacter quisquiliarum]|uniref:Ferric-dicitrate binding protein FerR (Iron transport regulator) n=1 Tax=Rufibacter quisquiliarum TaxID=1549639 RepID=A0A839GJJ8_9BACT|nr:FecR domain-containing protein [Rufibacter quisquiliarum]MBA9077913.1 ferric-dicitrate binding protein FerR (iron transport regulator) [Rufibacter quisquiliarum]
MTQTTLVQQENPEWVLIAKALKGELTEQEQVEFSSWLKEDETHMELWAEASEIWDQTGTDQHLHFHPDADLAWEKVCAQANLPHNQPSEMEAPEKDALLVALFPWNQVYKFAAALVLAAGLAWIGYLQFNSSPEWEQVATVSGERKQIYLPDSSQVTLNGNSTLKYQTDFKGRERRVELTGEAFFDVKKNPEKPFIIRSGEAQTKVLGTSFNVRALSSEQKVTVAVETGRVSLSSPKIGKEVFLTPGFTGTLTANGNITKVETAANAPAWRTLAFNGATIDEVALQLECYFNVSIKVIGKKSAVCTFTGTFETPRLPEILQVLAASNELEITKQTSSQYTILRNSCQ